MAWWFAIPAIIQGVSTILGAEDAKKQALQQLELNRYNAQITYGNELQNIMTNRVLSEVNIDTMEIGTEMDITARNMRDEYNRSLIFETARYNDSLFAQDIENVWAQHGLDVQMLEVQRARERGDMVATQSASGTVIGDGSNADAVIDQMAQEEMDKFVLKTGANIQAAKIMNARMQSSYEAEQAIKSITYEGRMSEIESRTALAMKSAGTRMESTITNMAQLNTATNQYISGLSGADAQAAAAQTKINGNFMSGMFGAASTFASSYAAYKGK